MRVLFDTCVLQPLRKTLPGHTIKTAQEMGWDRLRHGELIRMAEGSFDVLITSDLKLKYQQNLSGGAIIGMSFLMPTTSQWAAYLERSLRLPRNCARSTGLRTPDAIQLATANRCGASFFFTNDAGLPSLVSLKTIVLAHLVQNR